MRTLSDQTLEIIDDYWAQDFGCRRDELRPSVPRVQAHGGGLEGYRGVFILAVGVAPVVSAPPGMAAILGPRAPLFTDETIGDPSTLRDLLAPAAAARIIGPAHLS